MIGGVGAADAAAVRWAVEFAACYSQYEGKTMSQAFLMNQIQQQLQQQGASPGTAREAAKFAVDLYQRGSSMGNADLNTCLKSAGEFAERIEKGFKFKMPGKR